MDQADLLTATENTQQAWSSNVSPKLLRACELSDRHRVRLVGDRDARLILKGSPDYIAIPPNQTAAPHCPKPVERYTKFCRHDVEAVEANARSIVGDVLHAARVNDGTSDKEHRNVTIDRGPLLYAPIEEFAFG